ncbi:hypothetical protein [Corallococcus caeni]|uniref:Symporter n=1 Tax=Corallococcus caeni TaxID=3082388 RepID=A0ABQ6QQC5_9BACT|nr:hypothetical protein ASNO1_24670 [Corallococcus sp. NO1]
MLKALGVFALSHVVVLFMFHAGLAQGAGGLARVFQRPALYGRALAVALVAVPLVAYALVSLFRVPPVAAGSLVLLALCPGAPLQVKQAQALGASVTTSLNLVLLLALCSLVSVPLWVAALDGLRGFHLQANPSEVLKLVLVKLVPPLVAGMAVRFLFPRAAEVLAVWVHRLFSVLLLVTAGLVLFLAAPRLKDLGWSSVLALAGTVSAAALMGHRAGRPRPEDRRAVALAAALGNPGLAMSLVVHSYPGVQVMEAAAVVGAFVLVRALALVPYKSWSRRQGRKGRAGRPLREGSHPGWSVTRGGRGTVPFALLALRRRALHRRSASSPSP